MKARYTESFKRQAVEKALSRSEGTTLTEITNSLGVGYSTLNKRNLSMEIGHMGLKFIV